MPPPGKDLSKASAPVASPHKAIPYRTWPVIATTSIILIVTLVPGSWITIPVGDPPPLISFKFLLADFLANWMLFILFGASVGRASQSPLRALAYALVLSAIVETAQMAIPYRYSNPFDVVANAAGALTGALLWLSSRRWRASTDREVIWAGALLSGLIAAGIMLSNLLLLPAPPAGQYYIHAPPQVSGFEPLSGKILEASLDEVRLDRSSGPDSQRIRDALTGDFELRLRARLSTRPTRPSLLFMMSAEPEQQLALLLRIDGDDLVLRYRALSNRLSLEEIEFRADGLLQSLRLQETFEVTVRREGLRTCLALGVRTHCDGNLAIGDIWALYLPQIERLLGRSQFVSFLWIGVCAFAIGGLALPHWSSVAGIGLLMGSILAVSHYGPMQALSIWETLSGLLCFAIGLATRGRLFSA